ncbi:MAG: glycosyltransferase [Clostridia bacterium]
MAGDRIRESYNGEISERAARKNKQRIDWFANSAKGGKVLDIGCSQGITPILIGRRGIDVLAIDNDQESIDYANKSLLNENKETQDKVEFVCADFLNLDIAEKFDTVIMGEVLEHLFNPSLFLHKTSQLLKDDGVVLFSVPFGINPHWDHKRTYYFSDFYSLVSEHFNIVNYKFFMGTIAVVARHKSFAKEEIVFDKNLLAYIENAFFDLDTDSHKVLNDTRDKLTQSYNFVKKLKEQNAELVEKSTNLNQSRNDITAKLNSLTKEKDTKINELTVVVAEKDTKINELTVVVAEKDAKIHELEVVGNKKEEELQILIEENKFKVEMLTKEINDCLVTMKILSEENSDELQKISMLQADLEHEDLDNLELKAKIVKLNQKNAKINKELEYNKNKLSNLEKVYDNLCNSRFGRLQRFFWRSSTKTRKKLYHLKVRLKKFARKSKFLCKIVGDYRDRKELKAKNAQVAQIITNESTNVSQPAKLPVNNAQTRRKAFEDGADKTFLERIKPYLEQIPESNGSRYYKKNATKIGIICDEFLFHSFKEAAEFTFINPDNWKYEVIKQDILMVVSAWKGMDEEWRGLANEKSQKRQLAYEIIEYAKNNGVKAVFYSKEDPPNYDIYIEIAKKCEYIFTSCQEVIEKYQKDCKNENVFLLPFGINPTYHNPVGSQGKNKQSGMLFSGSWMDKYPERIKDMRMIFDGVISAGHNLKIIDRNYSYTRSEAYRFPKEYWKYISPEVDHETLQKIHKLYNWAMNVNTVTDSMSMFANRGYELQAAGNLIVSNYSMGMNSKLPMIFTVIDGKEVPLILNAYDKESVYERQMQGVRSVMTGETCFDRIGNFLEILGVNSTTDQNSVLVIIDEITEKVQDQFDNQTYKNKEICLLKNFDETKKSNHTMITFWDKNFDYAPFYLEDMTNGFKYTDCDYITKDAYKKNGKLIDGVEHDYVSKLKNKACTIFWASEFSCEKLLEITDDFELENGYSIDHFNFNCINGSGKITDPKLSVILPIYNNGLCLLGKAFSSLYRSTMFSDMEIILVDDGSTDNYTRKVLKYLDETYLNVKTYMFEIGGSGSASRPRNKGIELVTAEHVAYLDPDDEDTSDGYTKMYNLMIEKEADMVVGDVYKLTSKIAKMNYAPAIKKRYGKFDIINDSKDFLIKSNFFAMRIQAMIVKKSIVTQNNILQVVGAAGEDTLFCWELLMHSNNIQILDMPIHIYYAAVEGSVVNTIGKRFFDRYSIIENPKYEFLEKNDLLADYMTLKFAYYFENWTLKHLAKVDKENAVYCTQVVFDMFKAYKDVYNKDSKTINSFVEKCENNDYKSAFEVVKSIFK